MTTAPIDHVYNNSRVFEERLRLLDEDWGSSYTWHPFTVYGRPLSKDDLKHVKPDYLIHGVPHHVFYTPVIFRTEAGADAACKYIQEKLGDRILTLEYPDKCDAPGLGDKLLRTLYITFEDKELLIELHKICVAAELDLPFRTVYHGQVDMAKTEERLQKKNASIKVGALTTSMSETKLN